MPWPEGSRFDPRPDVEVSSGKTLTPKSLPMLQHQCVRLQNQYIQDIYLHSLQERLKLGHKRAAARFHDFTVSPKEASSYTTPCGCKQLVNPRIRIHTKRLRSWTSTFQQTICIYIYLLPLGSCDTFFISVSSCVFTSFLPFLIFIIIFINMAASWML